jgi:hypothetical protein
MNKKSEISVAFGTAGAVACGALQGAGIKGGRQTFSMHDHSFNRGEINTRNFITTAFWSFWGIASQ